MTTLLPDLAVRVEEFDRTDELWALPPSPRGVVCWLRGGAGLIGWGEAARIEVAGPDRFDRAAAAWRAFVERLDGDAAHAVAFASFSFDERGRSVLVVPRVLVRCTGGRARTTTIGAAPAEVFVPVARPAAVRWHDGRLPAPRWRAAVAEAVRRMRSGELDKVVLARDLVAEADEPLDPRFLIEELTSRHPQCWTFAVDDLVGATPEMLLRREGDRMTSRVLAGSSWTGHDLLTSRQHLDEHHYAVASLVSATAPHCTEVRTSGPSELHLRNISHLATDVVARTTTGLFELARAVHPTAAVGGTPRDAALRLIAELEGLDRGGYAGPVGWVDAAGDGELGIALRCARLTGRRARLFAGCGLIADSDPDAEVRESEAKFAAVRDAIEGR
ncbi:isochorismate synthase [Saccharopolyspora hirsuta]|uniref:Isochorismate synthase n=1 Tax=Saccharopolyspora hirsuta TaxID=1837 RepID=A0A5M7BQW5_SACHI|nr:chorismate-binding protein [Saccharopolyspora hirsuta]KAA5830538.1 isochorismate synthase [Saccharopolyspora hirsuta]